MKPLPEKWNRGNHGVTLVDRDRYANFFTLWFADDILLISGSLKHTTTVLDEHQKTENTAASSSRDEHRDRTARTEVQIPRPTRRLQKHSSS